MSTFFRSLPGRWQDKIIFLIGVLVFTSPWLFRYADSPVAAWNAWTLGVIFVASALLSVVYRPYWPAFAVAFMAFWHALAPRILEYSGETVAAATAMITGVVVVYLSLWSAISRAHMEQAQATHALDRPRPESSTAL